MSDLFEAYKKEVKSNLRMGIPFGDHQRLAFEKVVDSEITRLLASMFSMGATIESRNVLIAEMREALRSTCDLLKGYGHYVQHGVDLDKRAQEAIKP